MILQVQDVSKYFGGLVALDQVAFSVPTGQILGIIGPNGAGKSTLFRMITGKEQPDSGNVKIGPTVKLAFVDQSREGLENDKSVFDAIS